MTSVKYLKKIQDFLDLQPLKPKSWKVQIPQKWSNWFHTVARFLPPIEKRIGKEFTWFGVWALNEKHQREIEKEWKKIAKEYEIIEGGITYQPIRDLTQWLAGTGAGNLVKRIFQTLRTTYRYTKARIGIQNALQIIDQTFFSLKQVPSKIEVTIMTQLAENPTSTYMDLASGINIGERSLRRRLSQMREKYFFRIAGIPRTDKLGLVTYRFSTSKYSIELKSDFLVGQSTIWTSRAIRIFEITLPNDVKTTKYLRDFFASETHRKTSVIDKEIKPYKWLGIEVFLSDVMFSQKIRGWKLNLTTLREHYEASMKEENPTSLQHLLNLYEDSSLLPHPQINHLDLQVAYHLLIDYRIRSEKLARILDHSIYEIQKSRNKIIKNKIVKPIPWRWSLDLPETLEMHIPIHLENLDRKIHFLKKLPHTNIILTSLLPEGEKQLQIVSKLPRGGGRLLRRIIESDNTNQDILVASRYSRPYTYQPFPDSSMFNIEKQRWEYDGPPFRFEKIKEGVG
ncbi:MAG: hypothetical protein ACW976_00750 [Candidatus Ranarchaeia archaeon]|jgi:hypothetical protein